MALKFSRSIFVLFLVAFGSVCISAQSDATTRNGVPPKEDLPKGIQETMAKHRIEREKKDFAELLARGQEAVKLTDELEKSFTENNQLSSEDRKKLDRLEKVVKKIRNEIGANNDDADVEIDNKPSSMLNALKTLKDNTVKLVDELGKTTRHTVSVVAVESSNALLKVVRFLRFGKNQD
ncbi:MAG TPA: hypothetical protein VK308_12555 [Pyrinomonadaceae bacterium]|nr:hypothetical protein [Pyrinomonadaceae bacterium]